MDHVIEHLLKNHQLTLIAFTETWNSVTSVPSSASNLYSGPLISNLSSSLLFLPSDPDFVNSKYWAEAMLLVGWLTETKFKFSAFSEVSRLRLRSHTGVLKGAYLVLFGNSRRVERRIILFLLTTSFMGSLFGGFTYRASWQLAILMYSRFGVAFLDWHGLLFKVTALTRVNFIGGFITWEWHSI